MAIYHFSAQVISRSQGRSSVAASAYRSGEKIVDEKTGFTHDFTKKSDVINNEILLPPHAPKRLSDRAVLWNEVEDNEKRKDAQLAREITISLPRELNETQNWNLLKDFVQSEFVERGMIADLNFHRGHQSGEEQPHGHVMLTMREVSEEGFGKKVRAWNNKALLTDWREHWAEHCNEGLAKEGFDIRVDHRTLEEQGIDLEPQSKIGPKEAAQRMARFAEHQALAERNGERLIKDPSIALIALSQQQSTFTHYDIARFVNRHSLDKTQFTQVYEAIKAHPGLVFLGQDQRGVDRFSTQELLDLEMGMMEQVLNKADQSRHMVSDTLALNASDAKGLSDEQVDAFNHVTQGKDLACVVGYAGTGKSYMLGAAREAWEASGYRVQGMTLSGIAAENLESGSGIASGTVASRLWHWDRDLEKLSSKDIVVVDEAGMLGSRQMARIMEEAHSAKAKVVLVGDPEQLQAIEAGAAYRAIAECVGAVEMSDIRRQHELWQQQATRDFATAKTADGIEAYAKRDNVHSFATKDQAMDTMVERWDEVRGQSTHQSQIMLAHTRAEVRSLNMKARQMRHEHQELGQDHSIETSRGAREFADNDRIYFLRNENQTLGVKNGTLGTIERVEGDRMHVLVDGNDNTPARQITFSTNDYNDLDHGYAATVYKAQGVTVDRAHVLTSKYFDRHISYVAMSRHREGADLYYSHDEFKDLNHVMLSLSRERSKDTTLDYGVDRDQPGESVFAEIEPGKGIKDNNEHKLGILEEIEKALGPEFGDDTWSSGHGGLSIQDEIREIMGPDFDEKELRPTASRDDSLDAFMREFESDNPELAKDLARSVLPHSEQEALSLLESYSSLNLSKELGVHDKEVIASIIDTLKQDQSLLTYIAEYDPESARDLTRLTEESIRRDESERDSPIQDVVAQASKDKELDMDREIER